MKNFAKREKAWKVRKRNQKFTKYRDKLKKGQKTRTDAANVKINMKSDKRKVIIRQEIWRQRGKGNKGKAVIRLNMKAMVKSGRRMAPGKAMSATTGSTAGWSGGQYLPRRKRLEDTRCPMAGFFSAFPLGCQRGKTGDPNQKMRMLLMRNARVAPFRSENLVLEEWEQKILQQSSSILWIPIGAENFLNDPRLAIKIANINSRTRIYSQYSNINVICDWSMPWINHLAGYTQMSETKNLSGSTIWGDNAPLFVWPGIRQLSLWSRERRLCRLSGSMSQIGGETIPPDAFCLAIELLLAVVLE
jgi:hypothetical protein